LPVLNITLFSSSGQFCAAMVKKEKHQSNESRKTGQDNVDIVDRAFLAVDGSVPAEKPRKKFFLSEIFFWPANQLINKGRKEPLKHKDLWPVDSSVSGDKLWDIFYPKWQEELKRKKPSVIHALMRSFGTYWISAIFLLVIYGLLAFVPAIMLPYVIDFFFNPKVPVWYGFVYMITLVIAGSFGNNLYANAQFLANLFAMKARVVLTMLVYRKSLKLPPSSNRNSGQIVNLMSNDAAVIVDVMFWATYGIVAPVQIIFAVILMWLQIGPLSLIAIGVVLLILPIDFVLGRKFGRYRGRTQINLDNRSKLTNELLQSMRVIKFYAWENAFRERILEAREIELRNIRKLGTVRIFMLWILAIAPTIGLALSMIVYAILYGLSLIETFTVLAVLQLLRQPVILLPLAMTQLYLVTVSMGRINAFCLKPELPVNVKQKFNSKTALRIKDGEFRWDADSQQPILKDINLRVRKGELAMVIGSVGSGKSSLGLALLGEMVKSKGEVTVGGTIAYVSQQAWILNATVRDNILFGQPYNEEFYNTVVKASALEPDFAIMPAGDQTEIGSRGINLSGGQKQRIALARALYSRRDIYILDDPLSAVDAHVGKHIFEHVIVGLLKGKTIFFITNQLQYLPEANQIIVMKDGRIAEKGNYDTLMKQGGECASLMKRFGFVDKEKQRQAPQKLGEGEGFIPRGEGQFMAEERQTGQVSPKVYFRYVLAGGLCIGILLVVGYFIQQGAVIMENLWLALWSVKEFNLAFVQYVYIYVIFVGIDILSPGFYNTINVVLTLGASRRIHRKFLDALLRTPMQFYDVTPLGRIMNRVTRDMAFVDIFIPFQFQQLINLLVTTLSICVLLAIASYYILIGLVIAGVCFYILVYYYRRSYIEVQRLEALSRAPVFSHFSETLSGVSVIRAYGLTDAFKEANKNKINKNIRDQYTQKYLYAWLGIRLDWISEFIIICIYCVLIIARAYNSITIFAVIGVANISAITYLLSQLANILGEVETRMNSVERILAYIKQLPQEASPYTPKDVHLPKEWPQKGHIEFKDFCLRYKSDGDLVLKHINAVIHSREKIGIVGRTGSGKSSLVSSLFRIVEPASGTIIIDGIDIRQLGLQDLRSRLSIIPQEPTLFIGSIRFNLDPFHKYTDKQIWEALESVNLKKAIEQLDGKLDAQVAEEGGNFSLGQRQLLCMARALLKKSKILILDEATASVDIETDTLIQKTVRKSFKDCTILTIAHRLNTIMDSTRVMVLDKGQIVEFDTPKNLLKKKNGVFASMVEATGPTSAAYLRQIAEGKLKVVDSLKVSRTLKENENDNLVFVEKMENSPEQKDQNTAMNHHEKKQKQKHKQKKKQSQIPNGSANEAVVASQK